MGLFSFFSKKSSKAAQSNNDNLEKDNIEKDSLEKRLALATAYYDNERYQDAIDLLEKVILEDSSSAIANAKLGASYLELNNTQKAKEYLEKALSLDDKISDVHNHMGVVYISLKDFKSAISSFKKAIELEPTDTEKIKNLAKSYVAVDIRKFYYYLKQAEALGDKEATQLINELKSNELEQINSASVSEEERRQLLLEMKIKYLFIEEKYFEITQILNNFFDNQDTFILDIMVKYIQSLKKIKEYDKAVYFTHQTLEGLGNQKYSKDLYFLYLLLGMSLCHISKIKEGSNFIITGFKMNPQLAREFILDEKDKLVSIDKNGNPIIKLSDEDRQKMNENESSDLT